MPDKVIAILNKEVNSRLNQEFEKKVEKKSERKAKEKLAQKIDVEQPNWIKKNVEPKARDLKVKIDSNALSCLKGIWGITCDKCSTSFTVELTIDGIHDLLRNRAVHVECINPNCRNLMGRHRIKVELEKLIENLLIT